MSVGSLETLDPLTDQSGHVEFCSWGVPNESSFQFCVCTRSSQFRVFA